MLKSLLAAALVLAAAWAYRKLAYIRFRQYSHLPQHPSTLFLGHLKAFGEYARRNKPDAHPDQAMVAMHRALGRPPLMFVDMRPVGDPMVLVGDADIADQLTKASAAFPTSPPKSSASLNRLVYLLGPTSIFSRHGETWKLLRKRFAAGFAPQHLLTFVPEILEKSMIFLHRLDVLSDTGRNFSLVELATGLTFDIIGKVVMDMELDAQSHDDGPLSKKRAALSSRIGDILKALVRRKHAEMVEAGASPKSRLSVLSLELRDVPALNSSILDETCDQLRTFLFAGHDTPSVLISWVFYELSRTPAALDAVRAELDSLIGPDASPAAVRARLLGQPDLVQQMPYVSAVIKETLRLHPPGGTARKIPPGSGFSVRMPDGKLECLDGLLVYNCQSVLHRDTGAFGDSAEYFAPERWLSETSRVGNLAGAWRPFERGPRNCIGSELAKIEARTIIALAVRRRISFWVDGSNFLGNAIKNLANDRTLRVPLLGTELYIIRSQANVSKVFAHPNITVGFPYATALKTCFGMKKRAIDTVFGDISGHKEKPMDGLQVQPEDRIQQRIHAKRTDAGRTRGYYADVPESSNGMLLSFPGQDEDSPVSTDLGLFGASLINVMPSTMTLIYHIYKSQYALSSLRTSIPSSPQPPFSNNVEEIPLLLSMYAEPLRYSSQINIGRSAPRKQTRIGGVELPSDKLILINSWLAHNDEDVWNTKDNKHPLDTFWAERFIVDPNDDSSGPLKNNNDKVKNDGGNDAPFFSLEGLNGAWIPCGGK
ncbi:putative sterigmatocystin biosynthesis P450 monooxygenase stcS [Paramyrothecium foliicola]|nr:putative sterigmatocystin biosynthesis P450 monooxygenase stcS [Paramyrothecium foliicola]